jgi:hypothetical protein
MDHRPAWPHPPRPRPARWAVAAAATGALLLSIPAVVDAAGPGGDRLPSSVTTDAQPALSAGEVLVRLPWGDGPGEVGLASPAEGLTHGPEALAVAPDGGLIVLDSVNHRLVILTATGRYLGTVPVPLASPRFLAADDKRIAVLDADEDHALVTFDREGELLSRTEIAPTGAPVTGLFLDDGQPTVETGHDRVTAVPTQRTTASVRPAELSALPGREGRPTAGGRRVRARFQRGGPARLEVQDDSTGLGPATVDLRARQEIDHLVSLAGDGQGRVIVGARLLRRDKPATDREPVFLVARVPRSGAAQATASTLLLPESHFAEGGDPLSIAPDGTIYQPFPGPDGYAILVHHFPEGSGQ